MVDFPDIRIDILVDGPLVARIVALVESLGVGDYLLLTTLGGHGPLGRWRRDEVTGTTAKQVVVTVLPAARADALLAALAPLVTRFSLDVVATPARRLAGN